MPEAGLPGKFFALRPPAWYTSGTLAWGAAQHPDRWWLQRAKLPPRSGGLRISPVLPPSIRRSRPCAGKVSHTPFGRSKGVLRVAGCQRRRDAASERVLRRLSSWIGQRAKGSLPVVL